MHELSEKEYKAVLAATIRYVTEHNGTREDAEDLLQDELLKLYAGDTNYQEQGKMAAFIVFVVKNRWLDKCRTKKPKKKFWQKFLGSDNLEEKIDLESNIDYDNYLHNADISNNVQAAAAALYQNPNLFDKHKIYVEWQDTVCRKRLELAYIDGLDNKVIAAMENVKPNTFNQRLVRCCDKFIELCEGLRLR
jgi:RNA polymerase sigma factor (sigma-70 family)